MKISNFGESEIIKEIWKKLGKENENEDVHFIDNGDSYFLLAIDTINEDIHFARNWDPFKVGKFIVDINMSDIISKNGRGIEIMASMNFPRNLYYDWFQNFLEGFLKETDKFKIEYKGGDMKESKKISITGLVIGKVEKGKELRRKKINAGDYIYISNKIGKQYIEYLKYKKGESNGEGIIDIDVNYDKLSRILKLKPTACMDDSDGPFKSLRILAELNNIKITLKENVCILEDMEGCYSFGGDYELIFSSPIKSNDFPILAVASEGQGVYSSSGDLIQNNGYEHFKFKKTKTNYIQ